jgi:hypothetical protein
MFSIEDMGVGEGCESESERECQEGQGREGYCMNVGKVVVQEQVRW